MRAFRSACSSSSQIPFLDIIAFGAFVVVVIDIARVGLRGVKRFNFSHRDFSYVIDNML